jgi:hypothetical protein
MAQGLPRRRTDDVYHRGVEGVSRDGKPMPEGVQQNRECLLTLIWWERLDLWRGSRERIDIGGKFV